MSNSIFGCGALVALVALTGASACGGSDDGGGSSPSRVSSGVDETKPASSLTQADVAKICEAGRAYAASHINQEQSIQAGCVLLAAFSGGGQMNPTVAQCEASVKDCKATLSQGMGGTTNTTCAIQPGQLADCTATVQELEACLTASVDASGAALSKVNCSIFSLPPEEAQKQLATSETPPACVAAKAKCPSLQVAGGDSSSSPDGGF